VLTGGYPEPIVRTSDRRRRDAFRTYARAIVARDLPEIPVIERGAQLQKFLEALALPKGKPVNVTESRLQVNAFNSSRSKFRR